MYTQYANWDCEKYSNFVLLKFHNNDNKCINVITGIPKSHNFSEVSHFSCSIFGFLTVLDGTTDSNGIFLRKFKLSIFIDNLTQNPDF